MDNFEEFLVQLLKRSLKTEEITEIIRDYKSHLVAAFTSSEFDPDENYEFFEQIGDLSINKFIVTYMGRRFPQLRSSNGVGVLASLRILYGSKETLSRLAEKYGIDKYVRATQEEKVDKNKFRSILEDVFEALFGALEFAIDHKWNMPGLGYITVYRILSSMFDEQDIRIDYESLVDAKTRLNELKDEFKINLQYKDIKLDDGTFATDLYVNNVFSGRGQSSTKKAAQILAAQKGLDFLEHTRGLKKEVPQRYRIITQKTW